MTNTPERFGGHRLEAPGTNVSWENTQCSESNRLLAVHLSRWAWDSPTELPEAQRGVGPGARMSSWPKGRQAQRGFMVVSEGSGHQAGAVPTKDPPRDNQVEWACVSRR